MRKKSTQIIVIALCTSAALIGQKAMAIKCLRENTA